MTGTKPFVPEEGVNGSRVSLNACREKDVRSRIPGGLANHHDGEQLTDIRAKS